MKKNKKLFIRRCIIVAVFAMIIFILFSSIFGTSGSKRYDKTVLEIGDKVIDLSNEIIMDESKSIYLSFDDIKKYYDENIFYDEANENLITTYNKHIAILKLNDNQIEINDSVSSTVGKLQYINDVLYLPFSDMKMVYDFEYTYSDKTNILMVDSISNSKKTAELVRAVKIKKGTGALSKKILKLHKGKELQIFEEKGKYYRVRTEDGILGYANKDRFGEIKTIRESMENEKIENVNILSEYSEIRDDYATVNIDNKKNNVVVLDLFEVREDKKINLKKSLKNDTFSNYMTWLENNNIDAWATVTNEMDVSSNMMTYADRKDIINNIYLMLVENNFKVLNIDFEKINDVNSFYRFLIEITPRLKESGIKTVVTLNSSLDGDKVSKIVDYVVKEEK